MPPRLAMMAERWVEQKAFTRREVANLWRKAVIKAKDAALVGLSADSALDQAYGAGRLAAMAVLVSRHIRIRGMQGHHAMTFAALAALELPGCDDISVDSEEVRRMRHDSDYTAEFADASDVEHALAWVRRTLPTLRAILIAGDRDLASHLPVYP